MPVIRVNQKVYRQLAIEAGKRGCPISEVANALLASKLEQLGKVEVKQEPEGELIEDTVDMQAFMLNNEGKLEVEI